MGRSGIAETASPRVGLLFPDFEAAGAQRVLIDLAHGLSDHSVSVDLIVLRGDGSLRSMAPPSARVVVLGGRHASTSIPRLAAYLRQVRPDGLISALNHLNLAAVVANRFVRPRVPLVLTHHNTLSLRLSSAPSKRQRLIPLMARLLFPRADHVVAVSEGAADDLAATTGLARQRIQVVYNPVQSERVRRGAEAPVRHHWFSEGSRIVLGVGRLIEQKDFGTLIRAVAELPPEYRLIVLGEGEQRGALQSLADELGVSDRVDLHGHVDNPYPYFRAAAAFALSSRWEGLPTVLIEALMLGTPVVATDVPSGPREILEDGRFGRLVPPQDPQALAQAIRAAADGRSTVPPEATARYDLTRVTGAYLSLLGLPTGPTAPPDTQTDGQGGRTAPPPGGGRRD